MARVSGIKDLFMRTAPIKVKSGIIGNLMLIRIKYQKMQFEKGIPKITKKNGKRYIYVVTTLPSINSSGEHEESVELFELSEEPKKIYERSYEAWMQLLNRLTVGKGYYYQDNEGVDHPISKKVYHLIEKNCNQRLDEIKKRLI